MLQPAIRLAVILAAVFALALVLIWAFQERLVFYPPSIRLPMHSGAVLDTFTTADGQSLHGIVLQDSAAPPVGVLVHFHGNADLSASWIEWARELSARTGWAVFLAEYRGYGGLPGTPSYAALMRDANATLDHVLSRWQLPVERLALYGHSLGTGVASQLAAERGAGVVILECPPTSVAAVGRQSFGVPLGWFIPMLSRVHLAPLTHVATTTAPVWVAVAGNDQVIPPAMGRAVFAGARNKGELLEVRDATHNDVSSVGGQAYWAWLARALASTDRN